jgi:hypothetical protein
MTGFDPAVSNIPTITTAIALVSRLPSPAYGYRAR